MILIVNTVDNFLKIPIVIISHYITPGTYVILQYPYLFEIIFVQLVWSSHTGLWLNFSSYSFFVGNQKALPRLTIPSVLSIYYWTCSRHEYSGNTAHLSNNKSINQSYFLKLFVYKFDIYIIMWSCPGNMPKYYPGLRDILPSPSGRVICLSELGNRVG